MFFEKFLSIHFLSVAIFILFILWMISTSATAQNWGKKEE
jgi:hypothetical protein